MSVPDRPARATVDLSVVLAVLGERLVIRVDDGRTLALIRPLVADCMAVDQGPRGHDAVVWVRGGGPWTVQSDDGRSWGPEDEPSLVSATLAAVNLTAIGRTRALACHAAVLSREGATVALPAPSGRGKTTLTAAMLLQGWDYVSDEALALSWEDGAVLGYPRALALSPWSMATLDVPGGVQALGDRIITPGQLGARIENRPGPITHVVLLERDNQPPRLMPCERREAVAELLRRGFNSYKRPQGTLEAISRLVKGAQALRLSLGRPQDAARLATSALVGG